MNPTEMGKTIDEASEKIKAELLQTSEPTLWESFADILPLDCFTLIGKLADAPKKKAK